MKGQRDLQPGDESVTPVQKEIRDLIDYAVGIGVPLPLLREAVFSVVMRQKINRRFRRLVIGIFEAELAAALR